MKPAAAIILVVSLSTAAQAVEAGTLTLACKGTIGEGFEHANPEPTSMGLVVDFAAGTVQGFGAPGLLDIPTKIEGINETKVTFRGAARVGCDDWVALAGNIDRVTGEVWAHQETIHVLMTYELKCRPTQRLF
jgi:hypothetical protein